MSSVTSLCNIALSNIGKKLIDDINEQSTEAKTCKLHFNIVRDTLLQSYEWEFAKTTIALAAVANSREDRWEYAYTRPSNCLKPLRILPETYISDDIEVPYAATEGLIFCSQSPATLEYIRRFEDPTRLPPLFQDALAWALAAKIAIPLTSDQSTRKDAYQIAASSLDAAKVADANENKFTWAENSALIDARG